MEDLTPLYNKEFYLAYLCGEDVVLPIPDGNAERYLAYLCGMDVTIPDVPDGRTETYLAYKCGEDVVLPDPMYRIEYYLAKWCGIDCEVPEPMYRIEYWLAQLANSGELKTVTGNPISVSDALAKPAESLVIEILPQQSGSGDPSPDNVRPISGFNGVNIQRTGKNLLDDSDIRTYSSWGDIVPNGSSGGSTNSSNLGYWLPTIAGNTYTLSFDSSVEWPTYLYICKSVNNYGTRVAYITTSVVSNNPYTFTVADGEKWFIRCGNTGSENAFNTTIAKLHSPQLELNSTATAFEQYQGNLYTIDLDGTVYGGSLDVTTGVLTVTHGYIASYNGESLPSSWISDRDKYVIGTTPTVGAEVVYELATPTTIQLTPTEIEMLLGNNVIWNDVGDMVLEYLADGPADDIDALQILLGNRYVNNGGEDEATDKEALEILLGGNTR